jgi:hypothetical protein
MTRNITMAIDTDLLKKARKIAVERDTTVTGLIRNYLKNLVEQQDGSRQETAAEFERLIEDSRARIGEKRWSRDDLYER